MTTAVAKRMPVPLKHPDGYYFDDRAAHNAIGFYHHYLTHTKGPKAPDAFILEKWQALIIGELFGWKREDGSRQYTKAYVEIPRKAGKSTMAAGVALIGTVADHEHGAEVYSVAGDRKQAGIVYRIARDMVKANPFLDSIINCYGGDSPTSAKLMVCPKLNARYEVLSADASLAMGANPSMIIFDELHVQPNRELWDAMESGQGARAQPLLFAITTAGVDRMSVCYEQHQYALDILNGDHEDPSFYPVIFAADEDDDWLDPHVWARANPNLGVSCHLKFMQDQATAAKRLPYKQNAFKRLYLNIWTEQITLWLPMNEWDACNEGPLKEEDLLGRPCYGGLDLATVRDVAAFVLVFLVDEPIPDHEEDEPAVQTRFYLKCWFWVPEDTARERQEKSNVPYVTWADQGHMIHTPGNSIDHRRIRNKIRQLGEIYDIQDIGIDRWNSKQIEQDLTDDGFDMVPYGQGFLDMGAPSKVLETIMLSRMLHHFNNPVLRWMAKNAVVSTDDADNIKPSKKKATEKIDGIVATIMGIGRALSTPEPTTSVYDQRGLLKL